MSCFKRNPHSLSGEQGETLLPRWRSYKLKYFQGYSVGKAAVRVGAGGFAADVTSWSTPQGTKGIVVFDGPWVLHYLNVGLQLFRKKYAIAGPVFNDPLNGLDFSRWVSRQLAGGDVEVLYRQLAVVGADEHQRLPPELQVLLVRLPLPAARLLTHPSAVQEALSEAVEAASLDLHPAVLHWPGSTCGDNGIHCFAERECCEMARSSSGQPWRAGKSARVR